jgi:hypothetical protein
VARLFFASSKIELDWITSKVDLPSPDSYSIEIPSLAISDALTCTLIEFNKLLDDLKFDHALDTKASLDLLASSNNNAF